MEKENREMDNTFDRYYLSNHAFYFKYREDMHNPKITRAQLYKDGKKIINPIRVSDETGVKKTHHDLINLFEVLTTKGNYK